MTIIRGKILYLLIQLIRVYQWTISPLLGNHCRFYPSCSQYMVEALQTHGLLKGLGYGMRRLSHCHPLHPGGVDPVPDVEKCQHTSGQPR